MKNDHSKHNHCCDHSGLTTETKTFTAVTEATVSVFKISGMDCADEIKAIQQALNVDDVAQVTANLMSSEVIVTHHPRLSRQDIVTLIHSAGVVVLNEKNVPLSFFMQNKKRITLVVSSGFFAAVGLFFQLILNFRIEILFLLFLISALTGGAIVFPKAIRALKQKSLDMNVLMTMAVTGAFLIGEFSEGAAVVFLFSLAELLEAYSVSKARRAIKDVLSITPATANVLEGNGNFTETLVENVAIGTKILVRPGENVPLDGIVIEGTSSINQAPLTGESIPVVKKPGDTALAGTINESGSITIEVHQTYKETKIANVIKLVEEAQSRKAPSQLFVDKFAKIYTPAVTTVAILVFLIPPLFFSQDWSIWSYRALVFLVIACPCALVIATPVSVVSSLTALAKIGVLVKGGVFLENLGKLKALAVDKTGTITEGKPKVVSEKLFAKEDEEEFLKAALALEKNSTHPLAKAVTNYCESRNVKNSEVTNYKAIAGKGVEGILGQHHYFAGNHKLTHELNVCSPEIETYLQDVEGKGHSVMIVGHKPHEQCRGKVLGIFGLADSPRKNMTIAIRKLHKAGLSEITMISGDNQRTVDSIAKAVEIDSAFGDLLPENKVEHIKKLIAKHEFVGMVGDGINDAPALAHATVGIAMGAAGTDTAIETADIALMTDDMNTLADAVNHGHRTLKIIRFNISFALVVKAIFLGLGIFGLSNLWLAVAADMGASLLVIANSMRLLKVEKV